MKRLWFVWLVTTVGAWAGGCRSLAPPSFSNPGPAEYQQSRALRFDPYPEVEPGPAIVGARPLEYQKPPAEVLRARWWLSNPWESR